MKFLEAVLILSGMIIGVGIFAIPASFVRSGFFLGTAELAGLAVLVTFLHIFYGEIVLSTSSMHRLPGYARIYLGRTGSAVAYCTSIFGITGSLLAYTLVGSAFLNNIVSVYWPGSTGFFWAWAILAFGALIMLVPLRGESLINGILTVFLVGFLVFLISTLFPHIKSVNFYGFDISAAYIPYGVLLFALSGSIAIPNVVVLMDREKKKIRRAIIAGTVLPAVLYFLFAYAVVGVSGAGTTPEAILGLRGFVGEHVVFWGSMVGFLAVLTSFIVMISNFRDLFSLDLNFSKFFSWLLAFGMPAALYFLGFRSFTGIIGAVGTVSGGLEALLIVSAYHYMQKSRGAGFTVGSYIWKIAVGAAVVGGLAYEAFGLLGL